MHVCVYNYAQPEGRQVGIQYDGERDLLTSATWIYFFVYAWVQ